MSFTVFCNAHLQRFIENHLLRYEENALDENRLDKTVTHFALCLGESKRRIAIGLFVLHLLSACWGLEENYTQSTIDKMILECRSFLAYSNQV